MDARPRGNHLLLITLIVASFLPGGELHRLIQNKAPLTVGHESAAMTSTSDKSAVVRPVEGSNVNFLRSIFAGIVYGILHAAGPDHIGTLITLSAASGTQNAFTIGAMWGLGHSSGMLGVVVAIMGFSSVAARGVFLETWAYYGDYLIGFSMVLCALYFAVQESAYVVEDADGKSRVKNCACGVNHGYGAAESNQLLKVPEVATKRQRERSRSPTPKSPRFCDSYQSLRRCDAERGGVADERPAGESVDVNDAVTLQGWGGVVLGLFQGACCPMGLVGMSFMLSLPTVGIFAFALSFLIMSALGTGFLAMIWASIAMVTTPKIIYRISCGSTFVLGVAWIVATYFGVIEKLEFAENLSSMI